MRFVQRVATDIRDAPQGGREVQRWFKLIPAIPPLNFYSQPTELESHLKFHSFLPQNPAVIPTCVTPRSQELAMRNQNACCPFVS